eukprot:CAMPEP_0175076266 /NCGR_PEP_ID=MMETSP0052_2-20121109/22606_1 /TAXON_ID=51329 ORGANISM="Polytomella parva, Strain SAG 63-3" /NCGR_SAMPLE_ID=MMETSP0052_2 /ASSEMBLY_ACC=CAM_ASM_000194 /LENGTH=86 /DNA_ID=CAMNT_0016345335 /DNA_START=701 /DNA_END=961 /DNA_ORIENTATION=-
MIAFKRTRRVPTTPGMEMDLKRCASEEGGGYGGETGPDKGGEMSGRAWIEGKGMEEEEGMEEEGIGEARIGEAVATVEGGAGGALT